MRRIISTAFALILLLHAVQGAAESHERAYHLMSRRIADEVVSSFEVIERFRDSHFEVAVRESVAWEEMGFDILWSFGLFRDSDGGNAISILLENDALPDVGIELSMERVGELSSDTECQDWDMKIEGSQSASEYEESQTGVEGVTITGAGRILLCEGDTIPSVFSVRIERECGMAQWFSPNGKAKTESLEIAWARLY